MTSNYTGISGSRAAYVLASALKEHGKLLAVVSSGQAAARLADDLVFCMPELKVIVLPEEENRSFGCSDSAVPKGCGQRERAWNDGRDCSGKCCRKAY